MRCTRLRTEHEAHQLLDDARIDVRLGRVLARARATAAAHEAVVIAGEQHAARLAAERMLVEREVLAGDLVVAVALEDEHRQPELLRRRDAIVRFPVAPVRQRHAHHAQRVVVAECGQPGDRERALDLSEHLVRRAEIAQLIAQDDERRSRGWCEHRDGRDVAGARGDLRCEHRAEAVPDDDDTRDVRALLERVDRVDRIREHLGFEREVVRQLVAVGERALVVAQRRDAVRGERGREVGEQLGLADRLVAVHRAGAVNEHDGGKRAWAVGQREGCWQLVRCVADGQRDDDEGQHDR
jgi:hypothetical protein